MKEGGPAGPLDGARTDSSGVPFSDVPRWADSNPGICSIDYGNNVHDKPVRWRNASLLAADCRRFTRAGYFHLRDHKNR